MIIHFATVHLRDDIRIRTKEMGLLAAAFDDSSLYVQEVLGNEMDDIMDTSPPAASLKEDDRRRMADVPSHIAGAAEGGKSPRPRIAAIGNCISHLRNQKRL